MNWYCITVYEMTFWLVPYSGHVFLGSGEVDICDRYVMQLLILFVGHFNHGLR